MALSPFRNWLYRRLGLGVICCATAFMAADGVAAQTSKQRKPTGPRATGLIELAPNGKAHLIPITIMFDGNFYDASAYKAAPVPFALESGVVYEGIRNGLSLGEFTVAGALEAQGTWFGEGTWVPAGSKPAKRRSEAKPNLDDDSGPPRLRKANSAKNDAPAQPDSAKTASDTAGTKTDTAKDASQAASATPGDSATPSSTKPTSPATSQAEAPAKTDSAAADSADPNSVSHDLATTSNDEDPNRPVLHRGKGEKLEASAGVASSTPSKAAKSTASSTKTSAGSKSDSTTIQFIPAVSDAHGPEPRPYSYSMKPAEEADYRKKLQALASTEVQTWAKQTTPVLPSAEGPKRPSTAAKPSKPAPVSFEQVEFHAFDLWNNNEPVFVWIARAHLPAATAGAVAPTYYVTLVAKADIYLDLHKLLANVTDETHLDEFPRLELIDAVDVDGDGRGELLFRKLSEAGSAWAVYRAAADQLFPLFEGKPQAAHPPGFDR
jgi:hypothetical protein